MAIQGWKIDSTRMGNSNTWLEKAFTAMESRNTAMVDAYTRMEIGNT